jgi:hypothetical protein
MKTTKNIPVSSPATILKRIKERAKKLSFLKSQTNIIKCNLYLDTFLYVDSLVARKQVPSTTVAFTDLAKIVGVSPYSINTWYYAGKFMRDQRLDPESTNAVHVMMVRCIEGQIKKADFLKIVSHIKRNAIEGTDKSLSPLIRKARLRSGAEGKKKIRNAERSGSLNKTYLKMELMAMLQMAEAVFKKQGLVIGVYDKDDNELLEVK